MTGWTLRGEAAVWRLLLAEMAPRRRSLVLVFAASAAPVLLNLPALWLLQFAFDTAIPAAHSGLIVAAVAGMTLCRLSAGALAYWAALASARELRSITAGLRLSLMRQLHDIRWAGRPNLEGAALQGRLVMETERIENAANSVFSAAAPAIVPIVAFTAVMAWLSWQMTLLVILIAPLLRWPLFLVSRHVRTETALFQSSFERFNLSAGRLVRMLPVTLMQGARGRALTAFSATVWDLAGAGARMTGAHTLFAQANAAVSVVAASVILAFGGVLVANGALSLGSLAAFVMAAAIVGAAVNRLTGAIPAFLTGRESMRRFTDAVELSASEASPPNGVLKPDHAAPIALRDVWLTLGGRQILRGVSMEASPGKVTAVAAPNGQGKSTVIAMMLGLVPPDSGEVTLGGLPLAGLDLDAFRAGIGVVPQTPILLKGSIRDNVCFGHEAVTPDDLERALELSGCATMLTALGATVDTQIGDEGRTFSGGEAQRVAIARALVHRPAILFLDEPTNHLDDAAVDALIAQVFRRPHDRTGSRPTIVVATHDGRLLSAADAVYDLLGGVATMRRPAAAKVSR